MKKPFSYPAPPLISTFAPTILNIAATVWKATLEPTEANHCYVQELISAGEKVSNQEDLVMTL